MSRISKEETLRLIAHAQAGNSAAEDLLCRANDPLVRSVAAKLYPRAKGKLDFEDVLQHGRLGLLVAIRRYDPTRGCQLSTLAVLWIRQAISRAIESCDPIRVPSHAQAAGVQPATVLSLDWPIGEEENTTLGEMLPAEDDVEREVVASVWTEAALGRLRDRERQAVELHVVGEQSLAEVAVALRLSREGARCTIKRGLAKLEAVA